MKRPLVIAHRGASAYLPEHTLAAYALAAFQGADFIEPDLVMTRDGHLIARHDNQLALTTDVSSHPEFADRRRTATVDGITVSGWFSEDFSVAEIRRLRAVERLPGLRPANTRFDRQFGIPTLAEIIHLARSLSDLLGRPVGIYPETKHPSHFQSLDLAMETRLVEQLHEAGYRGVDAPVFIQSFETANLRRLRTLTDLPLVQLLAAEGQPRDLVQAGSMLDYRHMMTAEGLDAIAGYADAIGPDKRLLMARPAAALEAGSESSSPVSTTLSAELVTLAHERGLAVHPYTFRAENAFLLPPWRQGSETQGSGDVAAEIRAFLALGIDGFFVDPVDTGVAVVDAFCQDHS